MKSEPIKYEVGRPSEGLWLVYHKGKSIASAPTHQEAVHRAIEEVYATIRSRKEGKPIS